MFKDNKFRILITGGTGLLGQAFVSDRFKEVWRNYWGKDADNFEWILLSSAKERVSNTSCDLEDYDATLHRFLYHRPDAIIHLAAKVGGVKANLLNNKEFFEVNMRINQNVLKAADYIGCQFVISCLSTCVYPDPKRRHGLPYEEFDIHNGPPDSGNYGYAYAKRILDVLSQMYREKENRYYTCVIPNNLYGPHDNYDLENGHVVPSMIRKFYEAKQNRANVKLWGDGSPEREFTYVADAAVAIGLILVKLLDMRAKNISSKDGNKAEGWQEISLVNIGNTQQHTIKDVAEQIAKEIGFEGEIEWQTNQPNGVLRKPSCNDNFMHIFYDMAGDEESLVAGDLSVYFNLPREQGGPFYTSFETGIKESVEWFVKNYPNVRGVTPS